LTVLHHIGAKVNLLLFGFTSAVAAVVAQVAPSTQAVGANTLEPSLAPSVVGARGWAGTDAGFNSQNTPLALLDLVDAHVLERLARLVVGTIVTADRLVFAIFTALFARKVFVTPFLMFGCVKILCNQRGSECEQHDCAQHCNCL
jgi:hypothetical protein